MDGHGGGQIFRQVEVIGQNCKVVQNWIPVRWNWTLLILEGLFSGAG